MTTDLIARLAAANPVPGPVERRVAVRRVAVAAAVIAVLAPAAVAVADELGLSNHGTPVESATLFTHNPVLSEAVKDLGFPATSQYLGERDGIRLYVSRKPDGVLCFATNTDTAFPDGTWQGGLVGCAPDDLFPTTARPLLGFTPSIRHEDGSFTVTAVVGFASDAVAEVDVLAGDGGTLAAVPVRENIYAKTGLHLDGAHMLVAKDAAGDVVFTTTLTGRPGPN